MSALPMELWTWGLILFVIIWIILFTPIGIGIKPSDFFDMFIPKSMFVKEDLRTPEIKEKQERIDAYRKEKKD
tara:strand:+ start:1116 stop:1334 length:219 start_codon:yes stop_codon:yes gene_type:complete